MSPLLNPMSIQTQQNHVDNFRLYQEQMAFFYDDARFVLASGGVGSGESFAGIVKLFHKAAMNPKIILYAFAPTYNQVRQTLMREFSAIADSRYIAKVDNANCEAYFHNGARIMFRSADQEYKYKGVTMGGVYFDELTEVKEEIFNRMRGNIRQRNQPVQIWATTNPASYSHWVYNNFIMSKNKNFSVHYLRLYRNPYLPKEYIDDWEGMRETNPERHRIMVEGGWGDLAGLVFCLPMEQRIIPDNDDWQDVIAGVDFGWNNPTAVVVIDKKKRFGRTVYHAVDEFYARKVTADELVAECKRLKEKYNINTFYCDSNDPRLIEYLTEYGLPAYPQNKQAGSVADGLLIVNSLIKSKLFYCSPRCLKTLKEFDTYQWRSEEGREDEPLKSNDHSMDAIRASIYTDQMEALMPHQSVMDLLRAMN